MLVLKYLLQDSFTHETHLLIYEQRVILRYSCARFTDVTRQSFVKEAIAQSDAQKWNSGLERNRPINVVISRWHWNYQEITTFREAEWFSDSNDAELHLCFMVLYVYYYITKGHLQTTDYIILKLNSTYFIIFFAGKIRETIRGENI